MGSKPDIKLIDNRHVSDAAVNLALEEFGIRHLDPSQNYLLFYINKPAVIIGAHQNPWEQVHHQTIHRQKINVFRRLSGGGAVYHDSGNLSVAFITSHSKEPLGHFKPYMQPILQALSRLGIPGVCAHGNAIFINEKKISGFAQFGNLKRVLTHGTLLFNSDLEILNQTLATDLTIRETKAIASNKKEVANIQPYLKAPMALDALTHVLKDEITALYNIEPITLPSASWHQVHTLAETKYRKWDWTYGRSPNFVVQEPVCRHELNPSLLLHVNRGRIDSVEYQPDNKANKEHAWLQIKGQMRGTLSWRETLLHKQYYPGLVCDLFDN